MRGPGVSVRHLRDVPVDGMQLTDAPVVWKVWSSAGEFAPVLRLPAVRGRRGAVVRVRNMIGQGSDTLILKGFRDEPIDGKTDGETVGTWGSRSLISDGTGWELV